MTTLAYHPNTPLLWRPTAVRCISAGRPLQEDEPSLISADDIRALLEDGYGLIVELQPGDATRYSLVLAPTADGAVVCMTGRAKDIAGPYRMAWSVPVTEVDVVDLHRNEWSRRLIAWWLEELRAGTGGAP